MIIVYFIFQFKNHINLCYIKPIRESGVIGCYLALEL